MKKMLVALNIAWIAFLQASPAHSLPGWTGGQIRKWIKNHSFLSPNFRDDGAGVTWYIDAHRDVEGGGRIVVRYEHGIGGQKDQPQSVFRQVRLFVVKSMQNYEIRPDVWRRASKLTSTLLNQIYGQEVAQDFASSKLVYKAMDYYVEYTAQRYRRERIDSVPTQSESLWDQGETQLFQGKRFAYDVDSKHATLMIFPLKELPEEFAIMQHNQKINAAYQQQEARKRPVKLELN